MKNQYIFAISLLFLACSNQQKNTEIKDNTVISTLKNNQIIITKKQFDNEKMKFGTLKNHEFYNSISVNGTIDVPPENKASVSTFVGGYITKIPLLVGDKVKKGQLVASLKNTEIVEIQQEYLEIYAQLNFLKNEFKRQKTLFNEKITSQKNYLKAESSYKSSLATFNGLRQKLQMLRINPSNVEKGKITSSISVYAPITGFITKVNVSNGSFVSATSELLEIINTAHIHLELMVFEKDILKIKKHQKILFKVPESSDKQFNADVYLVGTSINKDRTITVHGHIADEKNTNFISGMFVEAEIIHETKKGKALPKTAIKKIGNRYYVLALNKQNQDNYIFEKLYVTLGLENENYAQIMNPEVLVNKKILTNGIFMLFNDE